MDDWQSWTAGARKTKHPSTASAVPHIAVAHATTLPNILTRSSLTAAAKSAGHCQRFNSGKRTCSKWSLQGLLGQSGSESQLSNSDVDSIENNVIPVCYLDARDESIFG